MIIKINNYQGELSSISAKTATLRVTAWQLMMEAALGLEDKISEAAFKIMQRPVNDIVVGGRLFWLFVLAGGPPYILYTGLIYHVYTLCIYATICIFGRPPAMSKSRPPTTMLCIIVSVCLSSPSLVCRLALSYSLCTIY